MSANDPTEQGRSRKEWHGPDRMILNAERILLVKPVTKGSKVAELIAQAK